jgi:ABC-type multidrug transport system ATPase subunit
MSLRARVRLVVVLSSYLPEILKIADRILGARAGKIVAEFDLRECDLGEVQACSDALTIPPDRAMPTLNPPLGGIRCTHPRGRAAQSRIPEGSTFSSAGAADQA